MDDQSLTTAPDAAPSPLVHVSIVVPVYDEEGAAPALAREIAVAFASTAHEIVFVDDASRDATVAGLQALRAELPQLRLLRHGSNAGQSRAIRTGVLAARGQVVVTLDGDGQNDPADAPRLVGRLERSASSVGLVSGRRARRQDSAAKRFGSRLANGFRRRLLRDGAEDTGCGLKAMRREAYLQLPYFDHMHRYLPALMMRDGRQVVFEEVGHRPRTSGRSKYSNFGRLRVSFSDLVGVLWLMGRARPPGAVREI